MGNGNARLCVFCMRGYPIAGRCPVCGTSYPEDAKRMARTAEPDELDKPVDRRSAYARAIDDRDTRGDGRYRRQNDKDDNEAD